MKEQFGQKERTYNGMIYVYTEFSIIETLCGLCSYPISSKTEKCLNPDCGVSYETNKMGQVFVDDETIEYVDRIMNIKHNPNFNTSNVKSNEDLLILFKHLDKLEK